MNVVRTMFALLAFSMLGGCLNMPTAVSRITGSYISGLQYESYDCDRLAIEMDSLARRENQLVAAQEQRIKTSKMQAFWYGIGQGDGIEASELANVRGEKEAVRRVSEKNCSEYNGGAEAVVVAAVAKAANSELVLEFTKRVERIIAEYEVSYTAAVKFMGWKVIALGLTTPENVTNLVSPRIMFEVNREEERGRASNRPAIISPKQFNSEVLAIVSKENVRYRTAVELLQYKYNLGSKATALLMNDNIGLMFSANK